MNVKNFEILCLNDSCLDKVINYYEKYSKYILLNDLLKIFSKVCKKKNLEVSKYLYSLKPYEDWIFDIKETNDIYLEEDIFCYLARTGYLELGKYIYNKDKDKINIYQKNNEPIVLAAQENNLEYVKWLFSLDKNINIFSDEIIITHSLHNHNNDITKWYIEELYKKEFDNKKYQIVNILNNLCLKDNLKLFKIVIGLFEINEKSVIIDCLYNSKKNIKLYLLENYYFDNIDLEADYFNLIFLNDIDIIKKFDDLCKKQECDLIDYKLFFIVALGNNKIEICDYIYNTHCKNNINNSINNIINLSEFQYETFLCYVCKMNNISLKGIKYICDLYSDNSLNISDIELYNMLIILLKRGKYKESLYIYKKLRDKDLLENSIKTTDLYDIFYSCNLKVIKWTLRRMKKNVCDVLNDIDTLELKEVLYCDIISNLSKSKKMTQIKIIKMLYGPNVNKYYTFEIYKYVINLNNIDILDYIYDKNNVDFNDRNMLFLICNYGSLDVFKWYLSKRCIYTKNDLECCFKIFCRRGNYALLNYLYSNYNLVDFVNNTESLFRTVCRSKNIRCILWIYELMKTKIFKLDKEWELIVLTNNYHLIRWILDNNKIKVNKIYGLKIALKNGDLDTMKLISSYLKSSKIKLFFNLYDGLLVIDSMRFGKIDILKYYEKYIDINILKKNLNLKLITQLCYSYNLYILDWIKSKIDIDNIIRSDNDNLFRKMCKKKNIYSIRYLKSCFSIYDYKKENDNIIPLIKDSIEYYYETNNIKKIIDYYKMTVIKTEKKTLDSCMICYNDSNIITNCEHTYCDKCIFK